MTETQLFRHPIETEALPEAEFVRVMGAGLTLSIVADGKPYRVKLNRRRLLSLMESGFEALKELEPGWHDL